MKILPLFKCVVFSFNILFFFTSLKIPIELEKNICVKQPISNIIYYCNIIIYYNYIYIITKEY